MSTATLHSEKKKALIPKLRFSGFDKNWETITLGDLLTFKNGLNSDKEKYGKGVKFINVLDILNNDFITYDKIIGSVEVTEKEFEKNEVSYGDILFQRSSETRAEVGQANVYLDRNKSSVFGGFVIRGKAKSEYEPLFMNYLLSTPIARKEITDKSGGSTRYNVGQDTLSKVQLTTTIISEQQKIASFLSAVDEKIQQLSRKKELLEQYKKGVMQQLFSGKLRFKDENEKDYTDWNYKKITDISKTSIGLVTTMTTSYVEIGIPLIRNSDIKENRINKNKLIYLDVDFATKHKHKKFSLGDIVTVHTGEVGVSAVIDDSLVGSLGFATLNTKVNKKIALPEFVCLYYNTIAYINYAVSMSTGDGRSNYNLKDFDKAVIPIPSLDEQKKIAEFINAIYDKIESTSQQINQTKSFKKGLLQQLFV
jgi:type I restriction enzyme S subunit